VRVEDLKHCLWQQPGGSAASQGLMLQPCWHLRFLSVLSRKRSPQQFSSMSRMGTTKSALGRHHIIIINKQQQQQLLSGLLDENMSRSM